MRLQRSGFSLVLSLTIMAAMVMMVIVLASFLQVESRLAQSHAGYLRARFNALASARIAIGQLQQLAGPDQRVTMRADMYADNDKAVGNNDAATIDPIRNQLDRANNHAPQSAKLHHQKRYLTGVWSTGGADSSKVRDWDVANPADSRLFLGWLASPFDENASPELSGTTPNFVPNRDYFRVDIDAQGVSRNEVAPGKLAEVRAYIDDILPNPIDADPTKVIPLVSFGSVNIPSTATGFRRNYFGAVDARPQPLPGPAFSDTKSLGANGRYAFWIGDEGVKAKINLPDFYAATTGGAWLSTEDWDKGFAASANQRNSLGVLGGAGDPLKEGVNTKGALPAGFNFDIWRAKDIADAAGKPQAYQLAKAVGTSGLSAWAVKQGGLAAGDAMNLATKLLWHDITTYSYSTLTDTYNGGVKVDLSTAFELPYAMYRGIELYPGQKDTAITADYRLRKQSLFHGAPNAALTTAVIGASGMGVDLDYNRPNLVDKLGTDSQLLLASPRASEWAPRFVKNLLGSSYDLLRARNGGTGTAANAQSESPERLGFVYEAPLRSAFFETYTINSTTVSRLLANTEKSPNATTSTWTVTNTINTLTERINVLPWSELAADHPENLTGRITRGPTWDLYRNYYRMYKRELEQAGKTSGTLRGQPTAAPDAVFARGVEPLTYASGNRFAPVQKTPSLSGSGTGGAPRTLAPRPDNFYAGGGALDINRYYYRNNLSAPSDSPSFQAEQRLRYPNIIQHRHATLAGFPPNVITNHDRMGIALPRPANNDAYFDNRELNAQLTTRTWPTSMSLAPSIVRFSMVFSGIFDQADSFDENGELNLGTIGVTVDPVVMVHNPYDVAIEFEGIAMVTNGSSLPYVFDVVLENWFFRDTHWQFYDPRPASPRSDPMPRARNLADPIWVGETVSRDLLLGEIALGDGREENRSVSFRLVNPGQKFRLEPGEVKTISTKNIPGASQSGRKINTTIATNDFGYDLGSNALYRMTPFANVRYRFGDIPSQFNDWPIPSVYNAKPTPDPRLWTWGFSQIHPVTGKTWVAPIPTGEGATPWFGFLGNYCFKNASGAGDVNPAAFQDALGIWDDVKNSRRIRDGLPTWKGDAKSLKTILDFPPAPNPPGSKNLTFRARNSGWLNYDHRVVGEEGIAGNPGYVFPRLRNGTTAVSGHQHWNFYLLNNRSIDGQALSPTRRWFGSPRTANPTYNATAGTVSDYVSEGSVTAEGQHLVDESLLLNFQALTAGWPNYGNDNGHWHNIIQYSEEWKNNVGLSPRLPDYRISTGLVQNSHTGINWRGDIDAQNTQVSFGPQDGDPEFGRPEITSGHRANSLGGRLNTPIWSDRGDTKQPFLLTDFVLRSAEMTERALNVWYPSSATSSVFNFKSGSLANITTPVDTIRAPMSPFFLSVRSQQAHLFGYDGKAHTPIGWVLSQRRIDSEPQIALAANNVNAYWGGSVSPSSNTRSDTILFPIPRRPLLSLAQLGSVGFAQVNTDADLTVGASFAHPGIMDLTKVTDWPGPKAQSGKDKAIPENGWVAIHEGTRIIRNRANVRTDHAFLANLALWDSYYFSGLNLAANSYSLPGSNLAFPAGPDLATDTDVAKAQADALKKATGEISSYNVTSFQDYKIALESGYNPLANKRVIFQPDNRPAVADGTFPGATEFPHPAYLSRNALYDGGFNVNSTSKQAWKTVLAGMRGQTLPDGSPASGTVLTRFARSFKPTTTAAGVWNDHRELSDAEIDKLAAEVVKEVRDRGPFMSLGDFINRRLLDSAVPALRGHGLKGALQAAIDKSGINSTAIGNSAGLVADGLFAVQGELNLSTSFNDPNGNTGGRAAAGRANFTDKNLDGGGTLGVLKKATNPTAARFPNVASMSETNNNQKVVAAVGAPQIVNQMDVLNTVGPNLTARSDTFTVRAYGEALDNAGNTIGRAWIEVVVQRTAQLMLPSSRGPGYDEATRRKSAYRVNSAKEYDSLPMVDPYESLNAGGILKLPANATPAEKENWHINRILGRRFKATSIRWLNANEI